MEQTIVSKLIRGIKLIALALAFCAVLSEPMQVSAASSSQKEQCKQEILTMLETADFSTHNISGYRVTFSELENIYEDLKQGEGQLIIASYNSNMSLATTSNGWYVKTVTIENGDSAVLTRYEKLCENVEKIRAGIEADMTDLDKVIYLHDEVVKLVTYANNGKSAFSAGGALGNGTAVCAGYTLALNLLLDLEGIEAHYVHGTSLNHAWSYVEIDGEWYHVDATHGDTRSSVSGVPTHAFVLRNDAEFKEGGSCDHGIYTVDDIETASDSTKYANWYMHDIVGYMSFDGGWWYYVDYADMSLNRGKASGTAGEMLADLSAWNEVIITDAQDGILTMSLDGTSFVGTVEELVEKTAEKAETVDSTIYPVTQVDMSDVSNWHSGVYHWDTGLYSTDTSRICLNDYVTCEESTLYTVGISNGSYQVLVRELDAGKKLTASHNLKDGEGFTTGSSTVYLAISMYNPGNSRLTFSDYQELFANGLQISVVGENAGGDVDAEPETDAEIETTPETDAEDIESGATTDGVTGVWNTGAETIDFADFSNWRSGCYSWTNGAYEENEKRLCLKDYQTFSAERFLVELSDTSYRLLIRELDADKKFLRTQTLADGVEYIPGEDAIYLAIGIYRASYESGLTYAEYEKLFAKGFYAGLEPVGKKVEASDESQEEVNNTTGNTTNSTVGNTTNNEENGTTGTKYGAVESTDFGDIANWRSGCYSWTNGAYEDNEKRVCLTEYKTFSSEKFEVELSDTSYRLLIRELNADRKFLRTHTLADGAVYTPGSDAVYLAIGVYRASYESGLSYAKYVELFENGFYAGLKVINTTDVVEDVFVSSAVSAPIAYGSAAVEKETAPVYTSMEAELKAMLESGDMTTHDVSGFNMTFSETYAVYQKLITGDCYLAYNAYVDATLQIDTDSNNKAQTIRIVNADSGFPQRYAALKASVSEALSGIDTNMSDVEKALVLHDYVVSHTSYGNDVEGGSGAVGPLASGKGICAGYTLALKVLLHEAGIEAYYLGSDSMNHAWTMAKLDGEWYHIDATWNDTRSRVSGEIEHTFFVRNDAQFSGGDTNRHYGWKSYEFDAVSTSTKYENWFVHDVVGNLLYWEGFWYYIDTDNNALVRSCIDGSGYSVVASGTGTMKLVSIENGMITYTVDGLTKVIAK